MLDQALNISDDVLAETEMSGSGAFSSVYLISETEAVKVCRYANSDAWVAYAAMIMAGDFAGLFVPELKSMRIDVPNNRVTAVMPKYYELTSNFDDAAIRAELWSNSRGLNWFARFVKQEVEVMTQQDCSLDADMHYNWMLTEAGEPRLTDPVVYEGWHERKYNEEDRSVLHDILDYLDTREHKVEIVL